MREYLASVRRDGPGRSDVVGVPVGDQQPADIGQCVTQRLETAHQRGLALLCPEAAVDEPDAVVANGNERIDRAPVVQRKWDAKQIGEELLGLIRKALRGYHSGQATACVSSRARGACQWSDEGSA